MIDALREAIIAVFGQIGVLYYACPALATQSRRFDDKSLVTRIGIAIGVQLITATAAVVAGSVITVKMLEKDISQLQTDGKRIERKLDREIEERQAGERAAIERYIQDLQRNKP